MNANHLADTRDAIILLGKEFEFASGIRALAADHIFREKGIDDPDELFDACEELIGSASLFESYDDALNTRPTEFVLGQGCPFQSLNAYIELAQMYRSDWVRLALTEYAAHYGSVKLRKLAPRNAEEMIDRARERLGDAVLFKVGMDIGKSLEGLSSRFNSALSLRGNATT
ncbi:hypothetical protein [Xanthomonas nasturtii]|uniref:Uncharacterized protein n=1 Tax=Xanthomonas nasturtii TaxID=1843581 RepID=A0ABT0LLR8_9XANT|nr:hypothetical protein [Xanthomonas nasturtii]MCL1523936.1 hypothetical protein [Xanthomonas nasturtii]MCL1550282.1 hypothetical protein [Xanthomonas nasturtii]MCL1555293.1 hypothetical protein [Xanthomonas nasturtii]